MATNQDRTAEYQSTLREHPLRCLIFSMVLGITSGLTIFAFTMVFGAHGGLPAIGFYILGPPTWLSRLNIDEIPFILTVGFATCVVWIAYCWFALVGTERLSATSRLIAATSFHVLSVAIFQILFGFP